MHDASVHCPLLRLELANQGRFICRSHSCSQLTISASILFKGVTVLR